MNKTTLEGILFATILIFSQSNSKAQTNEVAEQMTAKTNSSVIKQSAWLADEKEIQGGNDTNGWSCALWISNRPWLSGQQPPVCSISIKNISTNALTCWGGLYGYTYSKIDLLDSKGESVKKTAKGKQIGTRTNSTQIKEMIKNRLVAWSSGKARTDGFIPIRPGQDGGIGFTIPDLFELKQPGEYTLKVRTCLIERIGWKNREPELKIIWLPEVTTKIQIRLEDISRTNSTSAGQ